ncbi:response regulator [Emticicia sp. CRIBPO]|uniref:LytR/AlgR family response regulator transcription factor n=1 Tax=Emticicia sp. CRIBPO TaxID=2683258 RepID=UPI00141366BD|nr:LytTR family DNA-binding domain-containing protein [Emticicia sp. CRIBPO]NBA87274.1 response regulator [Emticicia sp. CRIBPO]
MIRAIAIDDELPALKVIENFCGKSDHVVLEKIFNKPLDGIKYLRNYPVDLLFLDINMPSITGVELFREISKESFSQKIMVIFTTAYSEYAVEGFNLNAIDYLLKPFTYERFEQSVSKAAEFFKMQKLLEKEDRNGSSESHMFIRADYRLYKINFQDILYIEGLDDYLKIHLEGIKPVVARMTMKAMEEKLPVKAFMRVHRSYIIPFKRIESVRNRVITLAGEEIPIGLSYEKPFLATFR